jgi:serine protease Do
MGVASFSITPQIQERFGLPVDRGAIVGEVYQGTPADTAGIRAGDIITRMDGKMIGGTGDLMRILRGKAPGDAVAVSGVREDGRFNVSVHLAEAADQ